MGCFCKDTVTALAEKVARLVPPTPTQADPDDASSYAPGAATSETAAEAQQIATLAQWVQTRLPQTPWEPDPAWADVQLPPAPLEPVAMATLASLAQAQQQIQQSLAIDLLQPEPAKAFRRVVATLNQRADDLPPAPDPTPWQKLAAAAVAVAQVEQALAQNLFTVTPQTRQKFEQPGGRPLREYRGLYQQVRDLAPLLAVAKQLQVELADPAAPAQLAQKLRPLRQVALPPLVAPWTMAQYTSLARALAQIEQVLGVDPTESDHAELQQMIQQRQQAVLDQMGSSTSPPALPASVANLVTPAVVKALQAVQPEVLQAMQWQVPPADQFPLVVTGLPAIAFIDTLRAMKVDAVRPSPCGRQCDAAAVLRDAEPVTTS